jgi:hypothetical protein
MRRTFAAAFLLPLLFATPAAAEQRVVPLAIGRSMAGELSLHDAQRPSGKFEDLYEIALRRGDRVAIALGSEQFDAFLIVTGPSGFRRVNDDAPGGEGTDSRIVVEAPADGDYRIAVTSYRGGETGAYRLSAAAADRSEAPTPAEAGAAVAIGGDIAGRLERGDRMEGERFADRYAFAGRRGQRVRIDMESGEFDTYLTLRAPDGTSHSNDDRGTATGTARRGRATDSRIETVLPEDGDYAVIATSYRAGATGKYRLSLREAPAPAGLAALPPGGRVIGMFVGVSDYGGRTSDLAETDADARRLRDALAERGLLHPASILLVNGQATRRALADAFQRIAAVAGPDDLFLFFFSGHGDQIEARADAGELDGRSETIELRDAALTDAELGVLFGRVRARLSLAAIDACYSGGFRNLVDRPGVIGLFSSEEDLTSLTAGEFKAGGYLSLFLREGIEGPADLDGDGVLTAGELATYLRRRFRRQSELPATTREDLANFQHLVIERGGVPVDAALLRMGAAPAQR